ncbi:hypothetical protein [uncultured Corynebacterium sp.]|uniref:hypothetical protein n=1 Tax=uncultured Corynebacterium sp. TaxID=159447 RepID=UPI0025F3210B|nr:hypothetical protein [uncultured Corynebacterium sp.]
MVLQRKTPGWWLWARFHRLPHNIVIAVVSTLALRMAILLTLESNGGTIEIEPLWLSFIASLPLVFIFSHETKPDLCAPRSLIRRRLSLLTSAVITGAIVSIACYPTNFTDFGFIAVFRNILGFLALGLLGRELLGQTRIWILPLIAAAGSMLFSWPQYPTVWDTVYGALRSPGAFYSDGTIDLSIPFCLGSFILFSVIYLRQDTVGRGRFHTSRQSNRFSRPTTYRGDAIPVAQLRARGWRRITQQIAIGLLVTISYSYYLLQDKKNWGGSPAELASTCLNGIFVFGSVAMAVGTLMGQTRWRTGIAVWEKLSNYTTIALLKKPALSVTNAVLIPIITVSVIALAANSWFLISHDVPSSGVTAEAISAATTIGAFFIIVSALALAGVAIGHIRKGIWVPSVAFILTLIMLIVGHSQIDHVSTDRRDKLTACASIPELNRHVCSSETNAPFLHAAARTLGDLYADAPAKQYLPQTLYLVDNAFAPSDSPMAKFGLYRKRSLTVPQALPSTDISSELGQTIGNSCKDVQASSALYLATPAPESPDNPPPPEEDLIHLQHCLNGQ